MAMKIIKICGSILFASAILFSMSGDYNMDRALDLVLDWIHTFSAEEIARYLVDSFMFSLLFALYLLRERYLSNKIKRLTEDQSERGVW